jgi:hypothetical protein
MRLPKDERVSETIGIRVTPKERQLLEALAEAAGASPSETGRLAIQRLLALDNEPAEGRESP